MKPLKEIGIILIIAASLAFAGYVVSGSGYMAGEAAGFVTGKAEGFKQGRVYQATVTPVIVVEKPLTIESLDRLSKYDIYDYLKSRIERERALDEKNKPKIY